MEWQSEERENTVIAAPGGAIDHDSAEAFQEQLTAAMRRAAGGGPLVVDLGGVDYMSSVSLRALMRVSKEAKGASVKISVANLNTTMLEIFQISRFDKMFPVHDSVDAALAS
jgi:anti-sigma B factor antagonist/stage II sporulation protein AA (anti-sigma F factor antagonist)